ncbi:hypothetical protein ABIA33_007682 [Streptacidiphilus sp. MAP12-16]|uniref:peptidase n=1 Tax=Streptacidiphilus sp. MAP12-16 TaxID=3156300 RepID=UPI00351834C0
MKNARLKSSLGVGLAAVATLAATALQVPTAHASATPAVLTDVQVAALSPAAQAALLAPLRAVGYALTDAGQSRAGSRIYANVAIDAGHHLVNLYVTDTSKAGSLIRAAKKAAPSIDTSLIRVHKAAYTLQELHAARQNFVNQSHSFEVYAVGPAVDGSGLLVEVADPKTTSHNARVSQSVTGSSATSSVKIIFEHGVRRTSKVLHVAGAAKNSAIPMSTSWAAVKWHDSAPFIGGDVITPDGHSYCTTGLPAVRTSDNHPIMITAAHCFGVGTQVYTGGGSTWGWGNGLTGNWVGKVTSRNQTWDAETLDGANNNADESDNESWKPLTSVKYSLVGDPVCQSGARSAYFGHGTPCGIKVTNQDLWFPVDGYNSRGVEGVDVNGWGSVQGDSGGIVFAITDSSNNRQARGVISAGGADGTADQARVDWTEAIDIFNAYGLKLNPTT